MSQEDHKLWQGVTNDCMADEELDEVNKVVILRSPTWRTDAFSTLIKKLNEVMYDRPVDKIRRYGPPSERPRPAGAAKIAHIIKVD